MAFKLLVAVLLLALSKINCNDQVKYEGHKIVGGYDAKNGEFPYQVSIRINNKHFCGGSILNQYYILTAAHCLQGQEPKGMTVVTGTNLLSEGGDSYDAETLIVHPGYLAFTITNDIALIKLKDPIKYGEKVSNIKLPTKDTTAKTQLTLSGWGTTTYPGKAPDKLQAIQLISISNLKCMMEHPLHVIVNTNLCTFTKTGEGACHGDSGGPLVNDDEQVGVVSWGIPCAKGEPDVFTRVYSYLTWINSNMKEK